ncbi:MAG: NAD(P)H-dependent oxidoreductase [Rhizomicrobium sp.]|nr:NAD(P)H-dependent oxidoreductase [Rhizomicrobium sp.]
MSNPLTKRPAMTVLGLSGSLRAGSTNAAVLAAAQALAPPGMTVAICDELGRLPFFNPDLEGDRLPASVAAFREKVGSAGGLLISSPEYAHGISGLLKNALDWLVPSVVFPGKPVAVVNASAFSTHAHEALLETLRTMSARLIPETIVTLPWTGEKLDCQGLIGEPRTARVIAAALASLDALIRDAGERF